MKYFCQDGCIIRPAGSSPVGKVDKQGAGAHPDPHIGAHVSGSAVKYCDQESSSRAASACALDSW